jgi:CheY-like chemotaxis protein
MPRISEVSKTLPRPDCALVATTLRSAPQRWIGAYVRWPNAHPGWVRWGAPGFRAGDQVANVRAAVKTPARILLVEDDLSIRESIAELLEEEGYTVICAANGAEALERLEVESAPSLIVLDLMMPVMDGWQFRASQQSSPEHASIPVVVISADGNARDKAQRLSAAGHLRKPISYEDLIAVVRRHCG